MGSTARIPVADVTCHAQINETSYVFSIERANEVNHLTVFLLGEFSGLPGMINMEWSLVVEE